MAKGFAYSVAIVDWRTAARLLTLAAPATMNVSACKGSLEEAINRYGTLPEIFDTDQVASSPQEVLLMNSTAAISGSSHGQQGAGSDNVFH